MYALEMDFHQEQLLHHCRICGNRLTKSKGKPQSVYTCADFSGDLESILDLGTTSEGVPLPPKFCKVCFIKLGRVKAAKASNTPIHPIQPMQWTSHSDDCKVRS